MKSLNFGASAAPRIVHAASHSHCSKAGMSSFALVELGAGGSVAFPCFRPFDLFVWIILPTIASILSSERLMREVSTGEQFSTSVSPKGTRRYNTAIARCEEICANPVTIAAVETMLAAMGLERDEGARKRHRPSSPWF